MYWTENPKNDSATHAIVIIHGSLRDGDSYWTALNGIMQQQLAWGNKNVDPNLIITAPEFYSKRFNSGLYQPNQLAWGDTNLWQIGVPSINPPNAKISSFAAAQALIEHFDNRTMYPKMKNVTLIGHSGGAQFVSRYASVMPTEPKHVSVRYVVADPSSSAYFTRDRPVTDPAYVDKDNCTLYANWRYGFNDFELAPYSGKTAKTYFSNYVSRDVVNLNGLLDTELNGDQQCMALIQGGSQRIGRNLAWWKYINLLARTDEDVSLFPGNFSSTLPDWSGAYDGEFNVKLSIVANATHDVGEVFSSPQGCSAILDDDNINLGWRPSEAFPIPPKNSTTPQAGSAGQDPSTSFSSSATAVQTSLLTITAAVLLAAVLVTMY